MPIQPQVAGAVFMGSVCIIAGLVSVKKSILYKKDSIKTTGMVSGYREYSSSSSKGKAASHSIIGIIEFYYGEEKITVEKKLSFRPKKGDEIKIKFNPRDPRHAEVDTFMNYLAPWIFVAAGIVIIVATVIKN